MAKPDGGPAFPSGENSETGAVFAMDQGMSLRQWYAGEAMKGYLSNPVLVGTPGDQVAGWAFQQADEMLEQGREK